MTMPKGPTMWQQARRVLKRFARRPSRRSLFAQEDYLNAYSLDTDRRVERDPHDAVGGLWEEMGQLQFDFLVSRGLEPDHRLLDIGCGTLRGGRHFIRYLRPGNYTGIDISPKALEFANQLLEKEDLSGKRPRLILNVEKTLTFGQFPGEQFDYLFAQSVFTHLPQQFIEECFANISRIMHEESLFFFTFWPADAVARRGNKGFAYPFGFFEGLARRHGFVIEDHSDAYRHPRGQRMSMLRPSGGPSAG